MAAKTYIRVGDEELRQLIETGLNKEVYSMPVKVVDIRVDVDVAAGGESVIQGYTIDVEHTCTPLGGCPI